MKANNGMKQCSSCKEIKPVAEYSRNRAKNDGLQTECRQCAGTMHGYIYAGIRGGNAMPICTDARRRLQELREMREAL